MNRKIGAAIGAGWTKAKAIVAKKRKNLVRSITLVSFDRRTPNFIDSVGFFFIIQPHSTLVITKEQFSSMQIVVLIFRPNF